MEWVILIGLVAVLVVALAFLATRSRARTADARAEARRWFERLGGQLDNLPSSGADPVRQALADASERYNAAGAQLSTARCSVHCGRTPATTRPR